jgi:hypothetical protein
VAKEIALKGSEKATHPKMQINWKTVRKHLAAGIDMTTTAAGQTVSEGLKEAYLPLMKAEEKSD